MESKTFTGATKQGCTLIKVADVKINTVTEEIAAKGVCGHIKDVSDLSESQKTEETDYELSEFGSDESDNVEQGFSSDEYEDSSCDEDDEGDDEGIFFYGERKAILADCHALKVLATAYMHPELPVDTNDSSSTGRNYFNRPSALEMESKEEAEERAQILADALALKKLATDYMHPEIKITNVNPSTLGRNFFGRPSAVETESNDEADERAQILADALALKKVASDYMYPEVKVTSVDPCCFGRNFFSSPSAVVMESKDEAEERVNILADALALKQLAVDYMHPENKVTIVEPCVFGRNYFERPSSVELETVEESEERAQILADATALKKLATDYMHPEYKIIAVDPCAFGRNYFEMPSAVDIESFEEAEERNQILADAAALKKLATAYMHPEIKVTTCDPCAFGRNYFERPSAVEVESTEEAEGRAQILTDAAALKKLATDYMHPEIKITNVNPSTFGRNFFGRPSAVEMESSDEADERAQILADALALKKVASDYMHPEVKVTSVDPCCFGRNFFSSPSAVIMESKDEAEERANILADALALKQLAVEYMHPENKVTIVEPCVFGRNYFERPSSVELETVEESEERAQILADATALKKLATDYMHPEYKIIAVDPCAFGRNYFEMPSAVDIESFEEAEERNQILADAAALKKLATAYMHPEIKVTTCDPCAFGRNYFERPSAVEVESTEEAEERAQILTDAAALKKLATDYMHPEIKITDVDPSTFGRNFFGRPSAVEMESSDEADERAQILADALALKKVASDYMHPEVKVTSVDPCCFGRNFFSSPSAVIMESTDEAEERAQILADAAALEKLAVDYMHPEIKVSTIDSCSFGRNYFERFSGTGLDDLESFTQRERAESIFSIGDPLCDMDETAIDEMRSKLNNLNISVLKPVYNGGIKVVGDIAPDKTGVNISRSPSSVVLFGLEESC